MQIISDLYGYVWPGHDNNCNSYVFKGLLKGNKHLVVDPGHLYTPSYREPGLNRLFKAMERDGLSSASIGLVVLTHAHPDHCESAVAIRKETGALIALHPADNEAFKAMGGDADFFLQEGSLELESGAQTNLYIYHSPGHTPGHIAIYWPDAKALIAGDCVFYRSYGRTDFPGGSAEALRNTIERLSLLDVEWLLCGHPYGHPGIIKGREAVQENFAYIKG
jgi:glyoxylase-like metal-dependent hydrolase (beta-lactamase superfamily II)